MKVAYNNCFGGFGLSCLALTEYAKKKGITLHWYNSEGFNPTVYKKVNKIPEQNRFSETAFTCDIGESATEYPKGSYYYPDFDRADKDLIEVIEELGVKANGMCASLAIKEIPDGAEYEITEYDGNEDVEPPRQTW